MENIPEVSGVQMFFARKKHGPRRLPVCLKKSREIRSEGNLATFFFSATTFNRNSNKANFTLSSTKTWEFDYVQLFKSNKKFIRKSRLNSQCSGYPPSAGVCTYAGE